LNGVKNCSQRIDTTRRILQNRRAAITQASSFEDFTTALQMVRVLEQGNEYYAARFASQDLLRAVTIRDTFMAENTAWLERTTKQKIVVWAHNGHVTFNVEMHFGWKPMGAHLRDRYGSSYRVWGFSFFEGDFYAQLVDTNDLGRTVAAAMLGLAANPSINRVPAPTNDSFERTFRASNLPIFMLDLRTANSPGGAWLRAKRPLYIVGQNLPPFREPEPYWYSYEASLLEDFDAIIYIDKTTPSTPI
jgi:erythromycin esterase